MVAERETMQQIKDALESYQWQKVCIWFSRLNSGKVKTTFGTWLQLCPSGTPDYICLIRDKQARISVLFIEAKSSEGKQSSDQISFQKRFNGVRDVYYMVIRDVSELHRFIKEVGFDTLTVLDDVNI